MHELEVLVIAFLLAGTGTYFAVQDLTDDRPFRSFAEAAGTVASLLIAHVICGLLLVQRSWDNTPKAHDPGTEERPGFYAAFFWMGGLLAVLAWSAYGKSLLPFSFPWAIENWDWRATALFLVSLGVAFAPLCYGYHLVALEAINTRKTKSYLVDPDGPISSMTILATIAIIMIVGAGAWAAGQRMFSITGYFGLVSMAVVVSAFLSFIVIANLAGFKALIEQSPMTPIKASGAAHPGAIISGIDALLVRLVAPLSGATLPGWFMPQAMLLLVMLPLAGMGYALPEPLGLVPISVAMIIILALGRRWAWVEDDREKALRIQTTKSDKFRIGFANDLRDEALMGYAWLFVLVPLALRQAQLEFGFFPKSSDDMSLINWFNFFGAELAKGVPIVSWIDIYQVEEAQVFDSNTAFGRHVIFASRLIIDVVIIAALLQAIGIAQRNSAQKSLFKNGQVDFFDPFMERKILEESWQAATNGQPPIKPEWERFFEEHRRESVELDRGDFRYNPRRLSELSLELSKSDQAADKRLLEVVSWLAEGLVLGTVGDRLRQLSKRYSDLLQTERADDPDGHSKRRQFERFLDDAIADFRASHPEDRTEADYLALSELLFLIRTDRGLDVQRTRAFSMLGDKGTLEAARVLAARLVDLEQAPGILGVSLEEAKTWHPVRQGRVEDRSFATEQLMNINMARQSPSEADEQRLKELQVQVSRRRPLRSIQREYDRLKRMGAGIWMKPGEEAMFERLLTQIAQLTRSS
ncbi:hypothetical protein [Hyphomonas sp.]|jgi:hypothetical protein|uniref:hypothetical protein n=1 Tax=Hyphomonas sp. TaxID=87 RepID=UPI0025C450CC|nr:hypothetical protein [Hyphomonas sp.]